MHDHNPHPYHHLNRRLLHLTSYPTSYICNLARSLPEQGRIIELFENIRRSIAIEKRLANIDREVRSHDEQLGSLRADMDRVLAQGAATDAGNGSESASAGNSAAGNVGQGSLWL